MLRIVKEHYEEHARILVLEGDRERLYIIDHHELLEIDPKCSKIIELGETKLCYIELGEVCEALALTVGDRREIISLRLLAPIDRDPAEGNPSIAREHCLNMLTRFHQHQSQITGSLNPSAFNKFS